MIILPDCPVGEAQQVLERVRERLAERIIVADLPPFTVSFGVASSDQAGDLRRSGGPGRCRPPERQGERARPGGCLGRALHLAPAGPLTAAGASGSARRDHTGRRRVPTAAAQLRAGDHPHPRPAGGVPCERRPGWCPEGGSVMTEVPSQVPFQFAGLAVPSPCSEESTNFRASASLYAVYLPY